MGSAGRKSARPSPGGRPAGFRRSTCSPCRASAPVSNAPVPSFGYSAGRGLGGGAGIPVRLRRPGENQAGLALQRLSRTRHGLAAGGNVRIPRPGALRNFRILLRPGRWRRDADAPRAEFDGFIDIRAMSTVEAARAIWRDFTKPCDVAAVSRRQKAGAHKPGHFHGTGPGLRRTGKPSLRNITHHREHDL